MCRNSDTFFIFFFPQNFALSPTCAFKLFNIKGLTRFLMMCALSIIHLQNLNPSKRYQAAQIPSLR